MLYLKVYPARMCMCVYSIGVYAELFWARMCLIRISTEQQQQQQSELMMRLFISQTRLVTCNQSKKQSLGETQRQEMKVWK